MKLQKRLRVLIFVLAGLLAVVLISLAAVLITGGSQEAQHAEVIVPGNVISSESEEATQEATQAATSGGSSVSTSSGGSTEDSKAEISLHRKNPEDSMPFNAGNMFPGDSIKKTYRVHVSYKGTVTLYFHADIRNNSEYEKLAEVLKCRVAYSGGETVYDGLMKDMPSESALQLPQSDGTTVEVPYEITAYLDTSVGNDYMNKDLVADFHWWVGENGSDDSSGQLISSKTGDSSNPVLWIAIAAGALFIMLLLLVTKRRKEGETADE